MSESGGARQFVPLVDERPDAAAWPEMPWPLASNTKLAGRLVRLTPTDPKADAAGHAAALDHDEVWTHLSGRPTSVDGYRERLLAGVTPQRQQWTLRLVEPHRGLAVGTIIGATSYLDVSPSNASLEIGSTSYTPAVWSGPVNPEVKLLLLGYAFEQLNAGRVQLKTDIRNTRSQRAIERLGAQFEGVLRRQMRRSDGSLRDTVLFSIIAEEWPVIRDRLQNRVEVALAAE